MPRPRTGEASRRSASTRWSATTTGCARSRSSAATAGARSGRATLIGRLIDVVTTLDPWVRPSLPLRRDLDDRRRDRRAQGERAAPARHRAPPATTGANRFHLGFNHFFYLDEHAEAADALEPAVSLPGAPRYLGRLVARLRSDAGGRSTRPRRSCTSCCARTPTTYVKARVREGARRDRGRAPCALPRRGARRVQAPPRAATSSGRRPGARSPAGAARAARRASRLGVGARPAKRPDRLRT